MGLRDAAYSYSGAINLFPFRSRRDNPIYHYDSGNDIMKYRRRYIPLLILIVGPVTIYQVQANGPLKFMVLEKVDLFLDGSITPILVNLTTDMTHAMRFVWNLIWNDNTIDFDVFGTLAIALTNGTQVIYNGSDQLDPITAIKDFGSVSYDVRIDSDDKNPKDNHLYSRLSFWKFVDAVDGLNIHDFTLQFRVRDNITAACDNFFVLVEGYKLVSPAGDPQQAPLNPFEYFDRWARWALTEPLIWLTIITTIAVFVFMAKKFNIF